MNKHSFFEHFSSFACLIAASAVLIVFLASCGREPEEQDSAPETSASVETSVVSATKTAPSANMKPRDGFVFPSKGLICVERVYYDASPTPDTEKVVYLRAPENAVDVVLPDGVTEIAPDAFKNNPDLKSIAIPGSVEAIGINAFYHYQKLERVSLPVTANLKSIGLCAFAECSALKEIAIPEGVETIGEAAFSHCRKLERVSLPASLKTIKYTAFENCSELMEITIPDGLTDIADDAFRGCPCAESVRQTLDSRRAAVQP